MAEKKDFLNKINSGIDSMSEYFIEKPIAPRSERFKYGPNEISNSLMNVIKSFGKKYGFINSDIILNWELITGADLSKLLLPVKIAFPMNERKNGVLWVKIKNASMSAVVQYQFPVIIDRVNTYFGYRAIAQVKLKY